MIQFNASLSEIAKAASTIAEVTPNVKRTLDEITLLAQKIPSIVNGALQRIAIYMSILIVCFALFLLPHLYPTATGVLVGYLSLLLALASEYSTCLLFLAATTVWYTYHQYEIAVQCLKLATLALQVACVKPPTLIPPTVRVLHGNGLYEPNPQAVYLRVTAVGGGGGGSGSANGTANATAGGEGGVTYFGEVIQARGGHGGAAPGRGSVGGAGGGATLQAPACGTALEGAFGGDCPGIDFAGASGGSSAFGGAGSGGVRCAGGYAGRAGKPMTGGGGGGGGGYESVYSGSGGGAGGYVKAIISAPAAAYNYSVGQGGAGGTAGTAGVAGGAGGSGYLEVTEYYY